MSLNMVWRLCPYILVLTTVVAASLFDFSNGSPSVSVSDTTAMNLYVSSSHGNDDSGNGSMAKPWATIQYAQQSVRTLMAHLSKDFASNITVNIEASDSADVSTFYFGPLSFTDKDSMHGFTNTNLYVRYQGYDPSQSKKRKSNANDDELPIICGGALIPSTSVWNKVSSIANTDLVLYSVKLDSGMNANARISELFMIDSHGSSTRMHLATSALKTYIHLDIGSKTIMTTLKTVPNIVSIMEATNYSSNLMAMVYEQWTSSYHLVTRITYDDNTTQANNVNITLATTPSNWVNNDASGMRFYLTNNEKLLANEHDFYFNVSTNVLYVVLPNTTDPNNNNIHFVVPSVYEILSINGDSNAGGALADRLVFDSLDVRYSAIDFRDCLSGDCQAQSVAFLQTATVHTTYASEIYLNNMRVQYTGGYGVYFGDGSKYVTLSNSYLDNLGAGGVRIGSNQGGVVSPESKLVSYIHVYNNYILNGGHVYEAGCGILAQTMTDLQIMNNNISNFKYTGLSIGWTWNYVPTSVMNILAKNNIISGIGQNILSDMGCVYTLGEQRNSLITNNICTDVYSYNYGGWGTYTDQASRFLKFSNNIVYNTKCAGHHQHYGLDNIFENNIYAFNNVLDCDGAIRSSQHPGVCNISNPSTEGACSSWQFITNIVYVNNTFNHDILSDTSHTYYKNMSSDSNTYWSVTQHAQLTFPDDYSIAQWQAEDKDVQVALEDPLFVDALKHNFLLQPSSPAIALGFRQIDTTHIGPDW